MTLGPDYTCVAAELVLGLGSMIIGSYLQISILLGEVASIPLNKAGLLCKREPKQVYQATCPVVP